MITAILRLPGRDRLRAGDVSDMSTEDIEWHLDHAERNGLDNLADHWRWILAQRRRREGCPYPSCHHNQEPEDAP